MQGPTGAADNDRRDIARYVQHLAMHSSPIHSTRCSRGIEFANVCIARSLKWICMPMAADQDKNQLQRMHGGGMTLYAHNSTLKQSGTGVIFLRILFRPMHRLLIIHFLQEQIRIHSMPAALRI